MDAAREYSGGRRGRRWQAFSGRLATTSEGVELALLRAFTGLRVVNLAQLFLAIGGLLPRSPRPKVDLGLALAFAAETAVVLTVAARRRTLRLPALVTADVVFSLVVLLAQPAIADPSRRVNTWDAWGYAITLSCALLLGMASTARWAVAGTAALTAAYLTASLGATAGHPGQRWTVLTNALAFPAFALIGYTTSGFLRRLGTDAETARALARHAGAEAEMERHRRLLHDHAALLSLLSSDAADDPQMRGQLRAQASAAAAAVTTFLSGTPTCGDPPQSLAVLVRRAAAGFPDLPLTVNADLAEHVQLPAHLASTLSSALATLLHNVRLHARATSCTLHADADPSGAAWEVSVRDDGVGFDPATTLPGYGLSRQVRAAANQAGLAVAVATGPGEGTAVTISHPSPAATPASGATWKTGPPAAGWQWPWDRR